ncbi:MAG: protein-export chaperone SecB [Caulobacteraceae bacterium]|nr:protein-export chaperone SecB [Caulobacteraceae bacterium]
MTDIPPNEALGPNGEAGGPPGIRIVRQFIRDVSFENPRAPESLVAEGQPQIEMGVELNARGRDDGLFDVELKLTASAKRGDDAAFHVEVVNAGLFQIMNAPPEMVEPLLLIECPRYLFPFSRRLISDLVTEGGFPPLQLDPIDFAAVYASRQQQMAQQQPVGQA